MNRHLLPYLVGALLTIPLIGASSVMPKQRQDARSTINSETRHHPSFAKTKRGNCGRDRNLFQKKDYLRMFRQNRISAAQKGVETGRPLLGNIVYAQREDFELGIYSVTTDGTAAVTSLFPGGSANGGAVLIDGLYYTTDYMDFGDMTFVSYAVYDTRTWEVMDVNYEGTLGTLALDMDYDETTGNVYGCFYTDDGTETVFGTLDLATHTRHIIRKVADPYFGVAVSKDGTVYALTAGGDLYTVDKSSGAEKLIGQTGLETTYLTSAAIDKRTGRFYYAVCTDEFSGLYEIDPSTAKAALINEFTDGDEIQGLCVFAPAVEPDAPAAVMNLAAEFDKGSLDGYISFDSPSTFFNGDSAHGDVIYSVLANGSEVASGTTVYGSQNVRIPVSVGTAGQYEFTVVLKNDVGAGAKNSVSLWVGEDAPAEVTDVELSYTSGEASLHWKPVIESANGGYIDLSEVTYDVTRYPENRVVASGLKVCEFSELLPVPDNFTVYYYGVKARFSNQFSSPVLSAYLPLGVIQPPYVNDFNNEYCLSGYAQYDFNEDPRQWEWTGDMVCCLADYGGAPMNSWLVSPGIAMKANTTYEIALDASALMTEKFEVRVGKNSNPESMTSEVIPVTSVDNIEPTTYKGYVSIEEDGIYYVGIHGCSEPSSFSLMVDNFCVNDGMSNFAPSSPESLEVTPSPLGTLSATISLIVPSKDIAGNQLKYISSIEICRDGKLIYSENSPALSSKVQFKDLKATQGYHTYSVTAYNEFGKGMSAEATAFVGVNLPGAPKNAVVKEVSTGVVEISWDAVDKDIDGNPINSSLVSYTITDNEGNIIADRITETTYSAKAVAGRSQKFVSYAVFASTKTGYNEQEYSATEIIPVGTPYEFPVVESFPGGEIANKFEWAVSAAAGSSTQWQFMNDNSGIPSCDHDNGFIACYSGYPGEQGLFYSGKIEVNTGENPILSFYYYAFRDGGNEIELTIIPEKGKIHKEVFMAGSDNEGWKRVVFPLDKYRGNAIRFYLTTTVKTHNYTAIDNIRIENAKDHDLRADILTAPRRMRQGEESTLLFRIENNGLKPASAYSVELYRDNELVQIKSGRLLAAAESTEIPFMETPSPAAKEMTEYFARVVYDADEDNGNDASAIVTVKTDLTRLPAPENLTAEQMSDRVSITWSEPNLTDVSPEPVTDDFEQYDAFETEALGYWATIDKDMVPTLGFADREFPGMGSPMSFIVFDSSEFASDDALKAHSGDKFIASFSLISGKNDDWLISPELDGCAQTVSFFAKTYQTQYGFEAFEFLCSSTDTEPDSFVLVGKESKVPGDWTEYEFEVPEGTKYFAIRCVTNQSFIFCVDDITYIPVALLSDTSELLGYNVYRDDEKINTDLVTATAYDDADTKSGSHRYYATAVYNIGESRSSNIARIGTDVISETGTRRIQVIPLEKAVRINNAQGLSISVYRVDGVRVGYVEEALESQVFNLTSGIYIVKVGADAFKVMIR